MVHHVWALQQPIHQCANDNMKPLFDAIIKNIPAPTEKADGLAIVGNQS